MTKGGYVWHIPLSLKKKFTHAQLPSALGIPFYRTKFLGVTIKATATEQYFPAVLF